MRPDMQSAACGYYQMQGAKRFLATLMTLGIESAHAANHQQELETGLRLW